MDYFHKMDTPFSAVLAFKLLFDLLSLISTLLTVLKDLETNSREHFLKTDTFCIFIISLSQYSIFHLFFFSKLECDYNRVKEYKLF